MPRLVDELADGLSVADVLSSRELDSLELTLLAGGDVLDERRVLSPRIQKPGLALAGFLPSVKPGRVQILGASEFDYLATLGAEIAMERLSGFVKQSIPLVIVTKGLRPPEPVLEICRERGVPLAVTDQLTSDTIEAVSIFLEEILAPRETPHGVLLEIFSIGTLIIGEPGIGKSECALGLIQRGHRLVADDSVVVKRVRHRKLVGRCPSISQRYLELRGVGLIDVTSHFGQAAIADEVEISLVVRLMPFELGEAEGSWRHRLVSVQPATCWESLGVTVPLTVMPVAPGRDLPILVETAGRRLLLERKGIDDESVLLARVDRRAQEAK